MSNYSYDPNEKVCIYCRERVYSVDEWGICDECRSTREPCEYCGKPTAHECHHCHTPVCPKCRNVCPCCPARSSICRKPNCWSGAECVFCYSD